MLEYIARFTFPDSPGGLVRMMSGRGTTDLEELLDGRPVLWQMPRSTLAGDIVWFQFGARSPARARAVIKAAASSRAAATRRAAERTEQLLPTIDRLAGHLIAVGHVTGHANIGEPISDHFTGRLYAPIDPVIPLLHPVPAVGGAPLQSLPAFAPHGPVTHRVISSDRDHRTLLTTVRKAGNTLPPFTSGPLQVAAGKTAGDWIGRVNDPRTSFLAESQLATMLGMPLSRAISDNGRVTDEVKVQRSGRQRGGFVDAAITIASRLLPVEFKLGSATASTTLEDQLNRYGRGALLTKKNRTLGTVDHDVALVVDSFGAHIYEGAQPVDRSGPHLTRKDLSPAAIRDLRAAIVSRLDGT